MYRMLVDKEKDQISKNQEKVPGFKMIECYVADYIIISCMSYEFEF